MQLHGIHAYWHASTSVNACKRTYIHAHRHSIAQHSTRALLPLAQTKEESFVEDINNLLNAGEVPNMFPSDERMAILEAVRPEASKLGLETPLELWGFFVQQVGAPCLLACLCRTSLLAGT